PLLRRRRSPSARGWRGCPSASSKTAASGMTGCASRPAAGGGAAARSGSRSPPRGPAGPAPDPAPQLRGRAPWRPPAEGPQAGYFNCFVGNDPASWQSHVAAYSSVRYAGLYDGVDVRVRDGGRRLEYDLLLAPGADLSRVAVRVSGASGLEVGGDGSLL